MDQTMYEYDLRQYRLMADRLTGFEKRTINLRRLINDLEALLDVLQASDETWKEVFRSEWAKLEDIYAVTLDRGENVLLPEDQKLVEKAVQNLKRLVTQKLRFQC